MLVQAFPKLADARAVRLLNSFFRSAAYPAIITAAMVCSEVFSLELAVFYFYLAVGTVAVLFAEDTLAIFPIVCCGYLTISPENSAYQHPGANIFVDPSFIVQFFFIMAAAVLLLAGRTVTLFLNSPRRGAPRLAGGFLLLGLAYILGGLPDFDPDSALYGGVQLVTFLLPYLFFLYTVDWDKTDKSYIPMLFTLIGIGVLLEIADMYGLPGVYRADGTVERSALYTGWGTYNNVGCLMAMCIPAPCYFAATRKNGWIYTVLSSFFLLGVALTQSRGSILFACIVYFACALYVVFSSKGRDRWLNLCAYLVLALALVFSYYAFREKLTALFASLLEAELSSSGRIEIYKNCWKTFLDHPVFGVGFYRTPGYANESVGGFMPPRAHNTYYQLLATGGIVAMAAYLVHRVSTLILLLRRPSPEKMYVFLVVLALVLTSILDCHFFNIGPGILYAALLAYAEGNDHAAKRLEGRPAESVS